MQMPCCNHVITECSSYCEYCWEMELTFREMSYLVSDLIRKFPSTADRNILATRQMEIVNRKDRLVHKKTFTPNMKDNYAENPNEPDHQNGKTNNQDFEKTQKRNS